MTSERERQEKYADEHGGATHHYLCDDGEKFSARSHTESGAFRVLNAERPGMGAMYLGCSYVTARR